MAIVFKHEGNMHDAFNVRANVFMVEQGFSYDFDVIDGHPDVVYITAYDTEAADPESPIGTTRIFPARLEHQFPEDMDAASDAWVVGRIAVMPQARHGGLGSLLLKESERVAAEAGASEMQLHAQVRAMPFYHANGYAEYGPYADDEGVPHQWMRKILRPTGRSIA